MKIFKWSEQASLVTYCKIGPDLLAFGSSAIEKLSGVWSHYCKIHMKAFLRSSIADFYWKPLEQMDWLISSEAQRFQFPQMGFD